MVQGNLELLLCDPQKGRAFISETTRSPFMTLNRNVCQAQNEQHDYLHSSSSEAFWIDSDMASLCAHKWTARFRVPPQSEHKQIHM